MFLSFRIGMGIFGTCYCHFYGKQNNLLGYKTRIKSIWDFLRVFLF